MAWPVYTERLVVTNLKMQWVYYNVPRGMRAVVKSINVTQWGTAAGVAQVTVDGWLAMIAVIPATQGTQALSTTAVCYGGAPIGIYLSTDTAHAMVSGYLFSDSSGRTGPPLSAQTLPVPPDPDFGAPRE